MGRAVFPGRGLSLPSPSQNKAGPQDAQRGPSVDPGQSGNGPCTCGGPHAPAPGVGVNLPASPSLATLGPSEPTDERHALCRWHALGQDQLEDGERQQHGDAQRHLLARVRGQVEGERSLTGPALWNLGAAAAEPARSRARALQQKKPLQ